jgi:hypothetical protein
MAVRDATRLVTDRYRPPFVVTLPARTWHRVVAGCWQHSRSWSSCPLGLIQDSFVLPSISTMRRSRWLRPVAGSAPLRTNWGYHAQVTTQSGASLDRTASGDGRSGGWYSPLLVVCSPASSRNGKWTACGRLQRSPSVTAARERDACNDQLQATRLYSRQRTSAARLPCVWIPQAIVLVVAQRIPRSSGELQLVTISYKVMRPRHHESHA